jgi:hypothetical protein
MSHGMFYKCSYLGMAHSIGLVSWPHERLIGQIQRLVIPRHFWHYYCPRYTTSMSQPNRSTHNQTTWADIRPQPDSLLVKYIEYIIEAAPIVPYSVCCFALSVAAAQYLFTHFSVDSRDLFQNANCWKSSLIRPVIQM